MLYYMRKYGANAAGVFWLAGGMAQLVFGGFMLSPRQVAAACCNIVSPLTYMFFGHTRNGVRAGCLMGELGTALTLWPDLARGDAHIWIGFGIFTVSIAFAFFSSELTRVFENSPHAWIAHSLGAPRRVTGLIAIVSRLAVIYSSVSNRQWEVATPFLIWLLGDISMSLSRSENSVLHRSPAQAGL